jgi:hypothetical protein
MPFSLGWPGSMQIDCAPAPAHTQKAAIKTARRIPRYYAESCLARARYAVCHTLGVR